MRVEPARQGLAEDILEGDLGAEGHLQGLALGDAGQSSLGQRAEKEPKSYTALGTATPHQGDMGQGCGRSF